MRAGLVVVAGLALAACAPSPAQQADICAIFALPGVPGETRLGDAGDLAWAAARERDLFASGVIYRPGWQAMSQGRPWGRCPVRPEVVEHLLLSPDRTYAMTKGGRRAEGRPQTFGDCFYDRRETGWRLRACRLKAGL